MEILKSFGVEPILLLAQIVNFVILLFLLQRFLYKPILKVLEERRKKIEASIKQAEDIEKRYEESSKKQAEILIKARGEAAEIVDSAKKEAKSLSEQMQAEAKKSIDETIKRTQESLTLEKQKIIAEARSNIVDLVATATQKVVSKTLKGVEKEKLIKEAVQEVGHEN
ncbi:MAG: F0F1 ATP synthase subunit B [Candidatus Woykebacteria bacterium]